MNDTIVERLFREIEEKRIYYKKKDDRYKKVKKWFKPFLFIFGAVMVITAILPFLAPITFPLVIIGIVLFLIRFGVYVFIFKKPYETYGNEYDEHFLLPLVREIIPEAQFPEKVKTSFKSTENYYQQKKDWTDSGLFIKSIDKRADQLKFNTREQSYLWGYYNIYNDDFTFAGMLRDIKSDIVDEILNIDYGVADIHSDAYDKLIFSGIVAEYQSCPANGNWTIVPYKTSEIFGKTHHKRTGYKAFHSGDAEFDKDFYLYAEHSGLKIPLEIITLLKNFKRECNDPVFTACAKGKLLLSLPESRSYWRPDFEKGVDYQHNLRKKMISKINLIHSFSEIQK